MADPVLSVHGAVAEWPPGPLRVLSLHRRAVNLVHGTGEILTLAHPALGNGPGTALVAGDWPLPLEAELRGALCDGVLSVGSLRLDLGRGPTWCPPSWPPALPP